MDVMASFASDWFQGLREDWDFSKNRGETPKMDGENNGKPYEQMDDLGVPWGYHYFWKHPFFSRC